MKSILAAFRFLTILPLGKSVLKDEEVAGAAAWFPLAGWALGGIYYGVARLLNNRIGPGLVAFLILALMALLTGALHLDGLSDWADSLGGRDRESRLKIMKDSAAGSFGIVAIALVLIGKMIALFTLAAGEEFWPLLLAPALARFDLSLLIATTPYARSEGGTGDIFGRHKKKWHLAMAALIALAPVIALRIPRAWIAVALALAAALIYRVLGMRLLGGFTGDLLGAAAEVCETAVLVLAAGMIS